MSTAINWPALISFLVVTLLSPGPNNLSCISLGIRRGYRVALTYIWGIVLGIFSQSLISGLVSKTLTEAFPSFESILRVVGALYVLWLAYLTLRSPYVNGDQDCDSLGFKEGFLLQFLNIKAILFVLTIYNVYVAVVLGNFWLILLTAVGLGARSFLANSAYALFGASIRRWMGIPWVSKALNIFIAALLAWNALDLLGIPAKLFR
jgi:cysteine/O-acetylserine efflux protein